MSGTLSNLHTINRLQRQQEAWLEMARLNRDRQSAEVVRDIVQIAAETLLVSQVGVWLFNEDGDAIHAAAIYRLDEDDYLDDITLNRGDYPIYFDALHTHKSIVAFNAREHESTLEFIESYLVPQNIFSMLDATILVSGKSRGVVCCEHKGEIRHWQNDEVLFASAVADQVAQVLMDEEKRSVEAQLRQAEKLQALGELAGGIAHDFNNQLTAIMGFADLIKLRFDDKTLGKYVDNIIKTSAHAAEIVKQLLAFARKSTLRSESVDVHDIVKELHQVLVHTFNKKISISLELEADLPKVRGDASQIQNALLNMALNARDAMPDGGELNISTETIRFDEIDQATREELSEADQIFVAVHVKDTGTGINADVLTHIFEPFFTTKETGLGTGMGLAAAYGSIKHMHGVITAQSVIGEGTCMTVFIPQDNSGDASPDDPFASTSLRAITGSGTILVIDDEVDIGSFVSEAVKSMAYTPQTFSDSRKAVEYFSEHANEIDLVLSDVSMPGLNGYEVLERLKQIKPDVRVVMSSGHNDIASAEECIQAGACDFIAKPYRMINLINKLESNL